jgi:hypothetical protein
VNAAAGVAVATSVPTVGTATAYKALGATATTTVGFTTVATVNSADDQVYTNTTVTISAPAGSAVTLADQNGSAAGTTAAFDATGATANLIAAVSSTTGAVTGDAANANVAAGALVAGTITFMPDVEGTYTLLVSAGNAAYTTGDVSAVWTVTTVGTPTGIALSSINSTTSIDNTTGSLVKVVLTDANGNVTMPGVGEAISLSSSDASFQVQALEMAKWSAIAKAVGARGRRT